MPFCREATTRFSLNSFLWLVTQFLFNYPVLWGLKLPKEDETIAPLFYPESFAFSSRHTIKTSSHKR